MHGVENDNDFYLNLQFRKAEGAKSEGLGYTDKDGNYIFELEASNENLDLQGQITLQRALLESEDFFLKNGVISNDHQHRRKDKNGNTIVDNTMVIGEPIAVKKDGKSTIVKGKLYGNVASAKPFIDLLKANSNRVRGSVGGLLPKVVKDPDTGIEKITHVLWNDLALTCSPVNNTVGYAVFAKSMNQNEILKALEAGYGASSAESGNGNALVKEDVESRTADTGDTGNEGAEKETLRALLAALRTGEVKGRKQAERFLIENGFDGKQSRIAVREIIDYGGLKMGKSVSETLKAMMKSLSGKSDDDSEKDNKPKQGEEGVGEDGNIDPENKGDDDDAPANDDDDDVVDGTAFMKALVEENEALRKSIDGLEKQIADMGEGMVMLGEMVSAIGGQKMPPRSVMNKSLDAGEARSNVPTTRPTQEDFEKVQDVLKKSVKEGEITLQKSSIMSSEFQRHMKTGVPISKSTWDFLSKKINGGK